ncbi:MAG: NADH-quinone oxidoreductase subunit NuoE [Acidobacteriota bacterium]|jgi:NADH-quinone oxidoreductase subunit E
MSFTTEELSQLDELRSHYPDGRAASVSVMKWVQRRDGHISDEALTAIADYLDLATAELEGLATFYNLLFRKPVGRHVIKVCDSISCWMCGYEAVRDRLRETLGIDFGQTTADGEFTLLPVVCLGNCDQAPSLMVNDDLHGRVTPEAVATILDAVRQRDNGGGENG